MNKIIILIIAVFCFSGCAGKTSLIVMPVKFEKGITDQQILAYAGDFKIMCAKVVYGGTALRFGSTAAGRGSAVAASMLGIAGNASRGVLGVLSMITLGSYEAQSLFNAKGKAIICLYGLRRIEKAEVKYARELLKLTNPEQKKLEKLTGPGLEFYEEIIKAKKVMAEMFIGQVPEKGDL